MNDRLRCQIHWQRIVPCLVALFVICLMSPAKAETWADERTCQGCHSSVYQQWQTSHHARAMTAPTRAEVDGLPVRFTLGYEPLQQFLIETRNGRLQAYGKAWDTERQEFFHLYPAQADTPDHPLHWQQIAHQANTQCIACHVTNYQQNYDVETDTFRSSWQALGVGCQSCHGPAQQHLDWAAQTPTAVNLPNFGWSLQVFDAEQQLQVCAQCHSRRSELQPFQPTVAIHDQLLISPLTAELYEVDGKIKDEVFEYGSFIQSRMHQAGVVCSDCHNPHSAQLQAPGEQVCSQCHATSEQQQHHFHAADSVGAQCTSCHMPAKVYMGNDWRHDHSFSSPNPAQALALGHSDACLGCHQDDDPSTVIAAFKRWYPKAQPRDGGYAVALFKARNGQDGAAAELLAQLQRDDQPAIRRAALLSELPNYPSTAAQREVAQALQHQDPMVRRAAIEVLPSLFQGSVLERLWPRLLTDPVRAVRVTALEQLIAQGRPLQAQQVEEYEQLQAHHLGTAQAHFNQAMIASLTNRHDQSLPALERALARDPNYLPALVALVQMREQQAPAEAQQLLRSAQQRLPEAAELTYALALSLVRQGQLPLALTYLKQATEQAPDQSQYAYVYAVALFDSGRRTEALQVLRDALDKSPQQRSLRVALLQYTQDERERIALLEQLQAMNPNDPLLLNPHPTRRTP